MPSKRRPPARGRTRPDAPEPLPDEQPTPSGSFMRRLSAGTAGSAGAFSPVEELFGPAHHQARMEIERQRSTSTPVPAPTDPPQLDPGTGPDPASRFRGRVVIRRPGNPDAAPDDDG